MPLYDYKCPNGHIFEAYSRLSEEPIACRECSQPAMITLLSISGVGQQNAQHFDPVVVFRDPDGEYRFPGQSSDPTPRGCERVELRTIAEVRSFEKRMNDSERRKYQSHKEVESHYWNEKRSASRADLREQMRHMSPFGRDFAELAMRKGDRKSLSSEAARYDPKFRVEVFSDNESNMHARGKR